MMTNHRERPTATMSPLGDHPSNGSANPIYLDYAATTPVAPDVAQSMADFLTVDGAFGNPSSVTHRYGNAAREAVEAARVELAHLIRATPGELVFTSGATESINLALKGVMTSSMATGQRLVVTATDHKAVLDTASWLADSGIDVTVISPDPDGIITPDLIAAHIHDTLLVSVTLVNNETGTVTDVPAISKVTRAANVLLHVDAAQAAARLPLDVTTLGADLISLSAHKMYGPKGIGALYIHRSLQPHIVPLMHGGGQEAGLRSGTLATHQIVGLGKAANVLAATQRADRDHIRKLDSALLRHLTDIDGCLLNGNANARVPGIINASFSGVSAESLMLSLPHMALSMGSACTSKEIKPSHVLAALGVSPDLCLSSIRFSFGRYTSEAEIATVGEAVRASVSVLRDLAL